MADVVKYGIQIPNRVFVGGVAFDTKEEELREFFTQYGKVKECKIVKDNQNISRGFGFVTFESKCDAIQAQQMGTVFFNQKKLNLGPAIRQKGVVFNGAKEAENEPVLSTGVYIHPSGYSYTVAPNGVWYFHNADGTPPPSMPGSPPMCYAPGVMEKTASSRRNSDDSSCGSNGIELSECKTVNEKQQSTPPPLVFQNAVQNEVFPIHPSNIYQTPVCQMNPPMCQGTSNTCLHSCNSPSNSNIHVAFQNMSISSHFHGNGGFYQQHSGIVSNPPHIAPSVPVNINGNLKSISLPPAPTFQQYEEPLICYAGVHNKVGYPSPVIESKPLLQPVNNRPTVIYPSYFTTEVCHPSDQPFYHPAVTPDSNRFYVNVQPASAGPKMKERCKY